MPMLTNSMFTSLVLTESSKTNKPLKMKYFIKDALDKKSFEQLCRQENELYQNANNNLYLQKYKIFLHNQWEELHTYMTQRFSNYAF